MNDKKGLLRKWVSEHTEKEQQDEINTISYLSYPYEKYGEHVLAFVLENGMNLQFCNLAKDFSDGLYVGYVETKPFVEYLGDRIVLALNYFKGKSNEEIKKISDGKNNDLSFGDYVEIEQKRYGIENEMYLHKVIGTSESNAWVDVPVQTPAKETLHKEIEPVVSCICCGVCETEVLKYRIRDVKKAGKDKWNI
jgi:hypothetical protein